MSTDDPGIQVQLGEIAHLRDEILSRLRFLGEDLKSRWDSAERSWADLQQRLAGARIEAELAWVETRIETRVLVHTLRDAYSHIRHAMEHGASQ